jgi:hypothetical protein
MQQRMKMTEPPGYGANHSPGLALCGEDQMISNSQLRKGSQGAENSQVGEGNQFSPGQTFGRKKLVIRWTDCWEKPAGAWYLSCT